MTRSEAQAHTRARTERLGVPVAVVVLLAWAASVALGALLLRLDARAAPVVVLVRAFLSTGLFITAHDAMHGLVAPRRPTLNDALGALALLLYAFLPYARLRRAHHEHHRIPARAGDPDFRDAGFLPWLAGFFSGYVSVPVLLANAALSVALLAVGVSAFKLAVLWWVPAFLSVLQLFVFGTYLPHREGPGYADDHRARSTHLPPALSFLSCYHFGYHWEHHEEPWAPWWLLPARRAARRSSAAS